MNQIKIGSFLKQLRHEAKLTQEELAERMNVSRRTVSRWETGNNLPDLSLLVELADFYGVDIREIFEGERKQGNELINEENTILQAEEYTKAIRIRIVRRMHRLFQAGCLACTVYLCCEFFGPEQGSRLYDFLKGVSLGIVSGMVMVGAVMTSSVAENIMKWKMKRNIIK